MTEIEKRVAAAQATLDRFKDRPFNWGDADCGLMIAFHLRQLGIRPKLAKAGSWTSPLSARRSLRRLGAETMPQWADSRFKRIPPAAALVGDLIELPGDHELGALTIAMGNGRVLGFHEAAIGAAVLQPVEFVAAWRVKVKS